MMQIQRMSAFGRQTSSLRLVTFVCIRVFIKRYIENFILSSSRFGIWPLLANLAKWLHVNLVEFWLNFEIWLNTVQLQCTQTVVIVGVCY